MHSSTHRIKLPLIWFQVSKKNPEFYFNECNNITLAAWSFIYLKYFINFLSAILTLSIHKRLLNLKIISREDFCAVAWGEDGILLLGGYDDLGYQTRTELYNVTSRSWTRWPIHCKVTSRPQQRGPGSRTCPSAAASTRAASTVTGWWWRGAGPWARTASTTTSPTMSSGELWPGAWADTCGLQIPFIIACLCKNLKDLNSLKVSNGHWTDCFCVHFIDSFLLKLCCSIGARILQFAALQTLQHSHPCCRYEPAADTWLQLDSMKHGRSSFAIQSVGGDLTAIAGWDVSILWS